MEVLEAGEIPCLEWPEETSRVASLIFHYARVREDRMGKLEGGA